MEDKKGWVKDVETLLKKDKRSYIDSIDYEKICNHGPEIVTITFRDGSNSMINVSGNSLSSILNEILRESYGEGAYGRVERKWW